ncbi:MAG TPA: HD domain-containing protein [Bacillota bacterium]|nr:HD domain-containing protein [Bacillota bacterium]HOL08919.1 HD domain-containing protein [Bacillota bacterium]HPO96612.1 HD domain-containing protein [Bacillota bacterium]
MLQKKVRFLLTTTEKNNFKQIPAGILEIVKVLIDANYQVYLVGGAVRDLLWDQSPNDWDLTTDALPDEIEALFPDTLPTGKSFGTITVRSNELAVEVTTMRRDGEYSDGRHPDTITFTKEIYEDLVRRDFTINALAYDFKTGELVDYFGGRNDLRKRHLKTVGDPQVRFREDALRMLRFFRFLATQDLRPDRATIQAIDAHLIAQISFERIRDELGKLLLGKNVIRGLEGLVQSGLLTAIIPEFNAVLDFDRQKNASGLWQHLLSTVSSIRPQLHLRWAALLHDLGKPATFQIINNAVHFYNHDTYGAELSTIILERLRYPRKFVAQVVNLVHNHMFALAVNSTDAAIRRLINKVGPDNITDLLELRRADIVATGRIDSNTWLYWQTITKRITAVIESGQLIDQKKLAISGHDLIKALNLKPGPIVGAVLNFLSEQVLDHPEFNTEQRLLQLAKDYLENNT